MSEQLWCYELLMEEFGPVPLAEVQQLIDDGMLAPSDRVRMESSSDWITVDELPAAVASLAASAADGVVDGHGDLDIDSINFEENPAEVSPSPDADLDIDAFALQGDSDSPQPVVTNPHQPTEPETEEEEDYEPEFYVQSIGLVLGPLTQEELVEMACNGSLSRGDELREGEDGRWIAVEAIPKLGEEILRQHEVLKTATDSDAPQTAAPKKKISKKRAKKKKPGAPGRKKKRRKKAKKDEFLAEIFAEVFTDDGKVREDRPSAAPADRSGDAHSATPVNAGDTGEHQPTTAGTPAAPSPPEPPPIAAAASPPSPAAPPPTASAAATAAFTKPPASVTPKKSSSGSGGFSMPEPKVLGMIAGGLVVVALIALYFTGNFPGFRPDPSELFRTFPVAYAKAQPGSPGDWQNFCDEFGASTKSLARGLAKFPDDPIARTHFSAAMKLQRLLSMPQSDKEAHEKLLAEFAKQANAE